MFVNALYRDQTQHDPGPLKNARAWILEADELLTFVRTKRELWWVWVALDRDTRPVVAMVAGDRNATTAVCLWDALPDVYRDGAIVATDVLAAYRAVVPEYRHAAVRPMNHVEWFWLTFRQRVGRCVRKTLSFSKCCWNHVGALWDFIRHYNTSLMYGHYREAALRFLPSLRKSGKYTILGSCHDEWSAMISFLAVCFGPNNSQQGHT